MRTRAPLAPPAIRHELARTAPGEHPPPDSLPDAHRARTEDDQAWRDAQSLLLPRHDCVAAEAMRKAVSALQLTSVRALDRATLDRCLVGASSWFRVAKQSARPGSLEALAEWGRFRIGLPEDPEARARAVLGWLPLMADPDAAWIASLLGRASWRADADERAMLERLAHWTLNRSVVREPDGLRAFGAAERTELRPLGHSSAQCSWSPEAAASMPVVDAVEAPRFVLDSLPAAARALKDWLAARGLVD